MRTLTAIDSARLSLLRFPLIVGVVYIHNYDVLKDTRQSVQDFGLAGALAEWAIGLMAQGIARLAVPIFFIISGYLFFLNFKPDLQHYQKALRKRIDTLLVPYLFWNLLVLGLMAAIHASPQGQAMLSGRFKSPLDFSMLDTVDAIFGIHRNPIAHHFWFIRDLMIVCLLSPLIYALVRWLGLIFLLPMTILWTLDSWPLLAPALDSILFFSIGCWVALRHESLFRLDTSVKWLAWIYIALLLASLYLTERIGVGRLLHNIAILFGVPCALYASRWVYEHDAPRRRLLALAPVSFFVYAAHDPAIAMLRKLTLKLTHAGDPLSVTLIYYLLPAMLILCLLWLYKQLDRVMPRLLGIVTGGR